MPISMPPPLLRRPSPDTRWRWELRVAHEPVGSVYTTIADWPGWPTWITVPGWNPHTSIHLVDLGASRP